jgi:metal-responsive CopG/Arc/MetJ family transcriptional regulator
MARPRLNRVRINITLPPKLIVALDKFAEASDVTRSDVIEAAAVALLANHAAQKPRERRR